MGKAVDGGPDVLSRQEVPIRRLSTAEYHRMAEAGILDWNDRVELIEGQLVEMSAIGPRHALVVDALNEMFVLAVSGRAKVRVQNPVVLSRVTEPNPDLVLARPGWRGYPAEHPGPGDVLLLVEVSDSSLRLDRGVKLEVYARAGIGEYWIVDLSRNAVHVHRTPGDGAYRVVTTLGRSDTLEVAALPGVAIEVDRLFV